MPLTPPVADPAPAPEPPPLPAGMAPPVPAPPVPPGGSLVVPPLTQPNPSQKVSEYTPDGKLVKEWSTPNVTTATRLTNGHILAASHSDSKVIELDATGKKVWEYKGESPIFRARRRYT